MVEVLREKHQPSFHTLQSTNIDSASDVAEIQKCLLAWYDANKRDLPWRRMAKVEDIDRRAYSVWVSEIMLQQTQVATVISYYNKWIKKWPTIKALSEATLEEVNELWSGLGYYSRARRLHEGVIKIMTKFNGHMPRNASELHKEIPGIGRYTASAIASISYGEVTGVVDGNVIRVLSRLRAIGAESNSKVAVEAIWTLANILVNKSRPGDHNQAVMELGSTVCTPRNPNCSSCPINDYCLAFKQVNRHKTIETKLTKRSNSVRKDLINNIQDIEEAPCVLCLPITYKWDPNLGVLNYPQKQAKKPSKEETFFVCIVRQLLYQDSNTPSYRFLLTQRPNTGLLAGMWQFPLVGVDKEWSPKKQRDTMLIYLHDELEIATEMIQHHGRDICEVPHIFSHLRHNYKVDYIDISPDIRLKSSSTSGLSVKWVTDKELKTSAITTVIRKIFQKFENHQSTKEQKKSITKRSKNNKDSCSNQTSLLSYWK